MTESSRKVVSNRRNAQSNTGQQCETLSTLLDDMGGQGAGSWGLLKFSRKLMRNEAVHTVRAAMAVHRQTDVLWSYQATLDNERFKAVRALRKAQKHRLYQAALNAKPN